MDAFTTDSKMMKNHVVNMGHKYLNPPECHCYTVQGWFLTLCSSESAAAQWASFCLHSFLHLPTQTAPPPSHVSFRHTAVYTYRQYTKFYYKKKNPFYMFSKFHIKNDGKHFSFNQTTDKSWQ